MPHDDSYQEIFERYYLPLRSEAEKKYQQEFSQENKKIEFELISINPSDQRYLRAWSNFILERTRSHIEMTRQAFYHASEATIEFIVKQGVTKPYQEILAEILAPMQYKYKSDAKSFTSMARPFLERKLTSVGVNIANAKYAGVWRELECSTLSLFAASTNQAFSDAIKLAQQSQEMQAIQTHTIPNLTDIEEYDNIISIIEGMAITMERSPGSFSTLDENGIRDHFLSFLNGYCKGQALAETYNSKGKTDILIRKNKKNIFIAECKIWSGPSNFRKTIDQLLGYLTWRDKYSAILIFNRNKNASNVIKNIPKIVMQHRNFREEVIEQSEESRFRYKLSHPNDPRQELTLTILVFELPTQA